MKTFLIGEPLSHSLSPEIHAFFGNDSYALMPLEQQELEAFLKGGDFDALNVTIPYKKSVIPYINILSNEALKAGAVNTIVKKNGLLYGYNTDIYGFTALVKESGICVQDKKCVIFGSGGASGAVRTALGMLNAREIITVSRSGENNYENLSKHYDAQILINATPLGMYPDICASPAFPELFEKLSGVFDLIYNPLRSRFLMKAEAIGIPSVNGLYMLTAQALRSNELFFGKKCDDSLAKTIAAKLACDMENIILIGMPGAGKTTIGRLVAEKLGRPFYDSDEQVERRVGKSPAQMIMEGKEEEFRRIEADVIERLSLERGIVLATGGGAINNFKSRNSLRSNGCFFFINRPFEQLETSNRPLSSSSEKLANLYIERLPLYLLVSDFTIETDSVNSAVEDIIAKFDLRERLFPRVSKK